MNAEDKIVPNNDVVQREERDRLWRDANSLHEAGENDDAIATARRVLTIERAMLGERHQDVARTLEWLVLRYIETDDLLAARNAAEDTLAITTALYTKEDWRVTDSRWLLDYVTKLQRVDAQLRAQLRLLETSAIAAYRRFEFAEAGRVFQQLADIEVKVLGATHPYYANSLVYTVSGSTELELTTRVYEIRRQSLGLKHPKTAESAMSMGLWLMEQKSFDAAETYFLQASESFKGTLGESSDKYLTSLMGLCFVHEESGNFKKAVEARENRIAALEAAHVSDDTYRSELTTFQRLLSTYAASFEEKGDFDGALSFRLQEVAFMKRLHGDNDYRTTEAAVAAATCRTMGKLTPAQRRELGQATLYTNNAYKAQDTGIIGIAIFMESNALEIRRRILGDQHPETANSLAHLGVLHRLKGNLEKSEGVLLESLTIRRQVLGDRSPAIAATLSELGSLSWVKRDFEKAKSQLQEAIQIRQDIQLGLDGNGADLLLLGWVFHSSGDHRAAIECMDQSVSYWRRTAGLEHITSEGLQYKVFSLVRGALDQYMSLITELKDDENVAEMAYGQVLKWKGAVFIAQHGVHIERTQPEVRSLFEKWQKVSQEYATLLNRESESVVVSAEARKKLAKEKSSLEASLKLYSPDFSKQTAHQSLTVAQFQAQLPKDCVVLDFIEFEKFSLQSDALAVPNRLHTSGHHLAVFVLRADGPVELIDLGPIEPITVAIKAWRDHLQRGVAGGAEKVQEFLWKPISDRVGDAKLVLISPDGELGTIPWSALPDDKPGSYLVERFQFLLLPVPQLLPRMLQPVGKDAGQVSILLVGNVDYDGGEAAGVEPATPLSAKATSKRFVPLPGTAVEIDAIGKQFAEHDHERIVARLTGQSATETAFRDLAPKHRLIHLATHGYFVADAKQKLESSDDRQDFEEAIERAGLSSGIVLAGANGGPLNADDDGILTASEVATLNLSNVDLVVLSACETGLGEAADGEGLLGLQRAFQVAGSTSVVSSLWRVDDQATAMFMERFYVNVLEKKCSKVESLREAQLWMLKEFRAGRSVDGNGRGIVLLDRNDSSQFEGLPPVYWAAFVLSGDWR